MKPALEEMPLVAREVHPDGSVVRVGPSAIGGRGSPSSPGPAPSRADEQILETARAVKAAGATMPARRRLQAAHLARTASRGSGSEGLRAPGRGARARPACRSSPRSWTRGTSSWSREYADMLQVGARNMQNFALLEGRRRSCDKPVLLKRGLAATIEELLMAAEYILAEGNPSVILCERGIRTFETATRNTLDLERRPAAQAAHPPAGHRRSQPRHRALVAGRPSWRGPPSPPAPTA